jgi:hypothetical protein
LVSGKTSHEPSAPTPPQGPLRNCLGQVAGHAYPVTGRVHWPHIRQPNAPPLAALSAAVKAR